MMAGKKGLGKGLGELFGDLTPADGGEGANLNIPIQKLEPNPYQPRRHFDEEELQTLADSIAQHGVIQPLAVRVRENGYYQIVAGERRWRAARLAGLSEIPAVVIDADDQTAAELALIENLQRSDLDPVEEAQGYRRLIDEYGMTQERVAERVGKSRPAVANTLRLLALPEELLGEVSAGRLTPGHARAVLSLPEGERVGAARRMIDQELTVRQAEALCRGMLKKKPEREKKPAGLEVDYIAECEKNLSRQMGRGVKITNGRKKGRVELEFYGPDDLQKLLEQLQSGLLI